MSKITEITGYSNQRDLLWHGMLVTRSGDNTEIWISTNVSLTTGLVISSDLENVIMYHIDKNTDVIRTGWGNKEIYPNRIEMEEKVKLIVKRLENDNL